MNSPEQVGKQVQHTAYATPMAVLAAPPVSLLSQILHENKVAVTSRPTSNSPNESSPPNYLDQFLSASDDATRLLLWFGEDRLQNYTDNSNHWMIEQIDRDIAKIDSMVQAQLNAVLHSHLFQRLEASWRGIEYLVDKREQHSDSRIIIKLLNVTWSELNRDFESIVEFDQSQLFKKIYEGGIGQAGAEPFSTIIADYFIHPRLSREHRFDDMNILRGLAQVAAAAFCPLIINAHPSMFAMDYFSDFKSRIDLQKLHSGLDFFAWQRFRELEDSRFVGIALPQLLMRRPYRRNYDLGFPFTEVVADAKDYLWGGAAFGMAEVLMRAFADFGWFANIRGAQRGLAGGGIVTGPAFDPFDTEPLDNSVRSITDIVMTDDMERDLASAGFLPLCACKEMPVATFYSSSSAQKPKQYNTPEATVSARLSTMLNHMLCVSRFAHYLKCIARDKIGSCASAEELQDILQSWIHAYVLPDKDADPVVRLRKPLLEAEIKVIAIPGRAGEYESIFHLVPHHELDDMRVSIRLDTKLMPAGR